MAYEIIEEIQEKSGGWRVRLQLANDECIFLWFDHKPTAKDIPIVKDILDNLKAKRIADKADADADSADKMTLREAIYNYKPSWSNANTRTLLEAIIARIKLRDNL